MLAKDARLERLMEEVEAVRRRWHEERPATDRTAFDRMSLMRSSPFAVAEAGKLLDLVRPSSAATLH